MRNKLTVIALLVAGATWGLTGCIGAGSNTDVAAAPGRFPQVTGIDLLGTQRRVPNDLPGSPRLIVAAYLRHQQADVDTWIENLDQVRARLPEVEFCELPVIQKGNPLFRLWLNNGMRSGIPDPKRREQVITVYTDVPGFLAAVGQKQNSHIMTFLVDRDGRIRAKVPGRFSEDNLELLLKGWAAPAAP